MDIFQRLQNNQCPHIIEQILERLTRWDLENLSCTSSLLNFSIKKLQKSESFSRKIRWNRPSSIEIFKKFFCGKIFIQDHLPSGNGIEVDSDRIGWGSYHFDAFDRIYIN